MAYSESTPDFRCSSNAAFRAWVDAVIDACVAAGLVQTSDTGQIDVATVNNPANDTVGGYAVFRFDDDLQSTAPVFIRLNFFHAAGSQPGYVTANFGTGSNGSGTITGDAGYAGTADTSTNASTTGRVVAAMVDGAFVLILFSGSSASAGYTVGFVWVERLRWVDTGEQSPRWSAWAGYSWTNQPAAPQMYFNGTTWDTSFDYRSIQGPATVDGHSRVGCSLPGEGPYAPYRGLLFGHTGAFTVNDTGDILIRGEPLPYKCLDVTDSFTHSIQQRMLVMHP